MRRCYDCTRHRFPCFRACVEVEWSSQRCSRKAAASTCCLEKGITALALLPWWWLDMVAVVKHVWACVKQGVVCAEFLAKRSSHD